VRRPTLCAQHAKGRRGDDAGEPGPLLPVGATTCPLCRQEADERVATIGQGTRTKIVVSSHATEDEYLSAVKSPEARALLAERREQEHLAREAEALALAEMDFIRPLVVDVDKATNARDRRAAHRRLIRASRGPSWES
jgi:hypothetical protein